jgi:hypothetical protein
MKKFLFFLIFLNSCTVNNEYQISNLVKDTIIDFKSLKSPLKKVKKKPLDFDKEYTLKEFKAVLKIYSNQKGYPDIN